MGTIGTLGGVLDLDELAQIHWDMGKADPITRWTVVHYTLEKNGVLTNQWELRDHPRGMCYSTKRFPCYNNFCDKDGHMIDLREGVNFARGYKALNNVYPKCVPFVSSPTRWTGEKYIPKTPMHLK